MLNRSLQIVLLSGSAEHPSCIRTTLAILDELLCSRGVRTSIWDLYSEPLPIFDPHYYPDPHTNSSPSVRSLARLADQADAFVWGSPVYHNSFSGVLKNALDSLSIEQFRNKPIALVSNGSSDRTGSQPCDQLRVVARGVLAVAIPTQLITLSSDFIKTNGIYHLTNDVIYERMVHLTEELIAYATSLRSLREQYTHQPPGNEYQCTTISFES